MPCARDSTEPGHPLAITMDVPLRRSVLEAHRLTSNVCVCVCETSITHETPHSVVADLQTPRKPSDFLLGIAVDADPTIVVARHLRHLDPWQLVPRPAWELLGCLLDLKLLNG